MRVCICALTPSVDSPNSWTPPHPSFLLSSPHRRHNYLQQPVPGGDDPRRHVGLPPLGPRCDFRLRDNGSDPGLLWRVLRPVWRLDRDRDVRMDRRLIYGEPCVQRLGEVQSERGLHVGDAVRGLQLFLPVGGVLSCASR